jgi:A/G-specific adenine glycosylase
LREALLRWYRGQRRDLPWRQSVNPYRTWVSEIMLQQTTVAAVTPKYKAFIARFPDVRTLAQSSEQEVLKYWAGLGYYSRARNLHRAANVIMSEHAGRFPNDFDNILRLPGIGRYSAGAILSIAFEKSYPVVDGNVIRVYSRIFGLRGRAKDPHFVKTIWAKAEELMPTSSPGDWNQALMELGATVCTPDNPSCGRCPVAAFCIAFKKSIQDTLPLPEAQREAVAVRWTCVWIEQGGKILVWKRAANERLLKNLWGLPEQRHLDITLGKKIATVTHTITHHVLTVQLRFAALKNSLKLPPEAQWIETSKAKDFLVSSLWLKLLKAAKV